MGNRFTRGAGSFLRWSVRPGFFGRLPSNPFAGAGLLFREGLLPEIRRAREAREKESDFGQSLDGALVDPAFRDQFIFHAYCLYHGIGEDDLPLIRKRAAQTGYIRLFLFLVAVGITLFFFSRFDPQSYFLFRVLGSLSYIVYIAPIPMLLAMLLGSLRFLHFSYCVDHRRSSSADTFLLWVTSPEHWFPDLRLRPVKPLALPPEGVEAARRIVEKLS